MIKLVRVSQVVRNDINSILHLSLVQRLCHKKSRRVIGGFSISIGILAMASCVEGNEIVVRLIGESVAKGIGMTIHAIGAVPIVKYSEPVWAIIMADEL